MQYPCWNGPMLLQYAIAASNLEYGGQRSHRCALIGPTNLVKLLPNKTSLRGPWPPPVPQRQATKCPRHSQCTLATSVFDLALASSAKASTERLGHRLVRGSPGKSLLRELCPSFQGRVRSPRATSLTTFLRLIRSPS